MTKRNKDSFLEKRENTVRSDRDAKETSNMPPVYAAGESVDQHKQIEEANEFFSEKEIKQSNNN